MFSIKKARQLLPNNDTPSKSKPEQINRLFSLKISFPWEGTSLEKYLGLEKRVIQLVLNMLSQGIVHEDLSYSERLRKKDFVGFSFPKSNNRHYLNETDLSILQQRFQLYGSSDVRKKMDAYKELEKIFTSDIVKIPNEKWAETLVTAMQEAVKASSGGTTNTALTYFSSYKEKVLSEETQLEVLKQTKIFQLMLTVIDRLFSDPTLYQGSHFHARFAALEGISSTDSVSKQPLVSFLVAKAIFQIQGISNQKLLNLQIEDNEVLKNNIRRFEHFINF